MKFGSAVILSGGKGSRLKGVDKGMAHFEGRPLAARMADLLSPSFAEILISTNHPERYAELGLPCVPDRFPGRGPLAGIHAALARASSDWVFAIASDMPFFSGAYALRMQAVIEANEAKARGKVEALGKAGVASTQEKQAGEPLGALACISSIGEHIEPFHAYYARGLLPILERLLASDDQAGRGPSFADLLALAPTLRIPEDSARAYTPDWRLFSSLNTPEDFASRSSRNGAGS